VTERYFASSLRSSGPRHTGSHVPAQESAPEIAGRPISRFGLPASEEGEGIPGIPAERA